jgi:hypothetical protein
MAIHRVTRDLLVYFAPFLCFGTASLHAQPPSQLKVTMLVAATPITGVPDKVFVMLTTEFPPESAPAATLIRATNTGP